MVVRRREKKKERKKEKGERDRGCTQGENKFLNYSRE